MIYNSSSNICTHNTFILHSVTIRGKILLSSQQFSSSPPLLFHLLKAHLKSFTSLSFPSSEGRGCRLDIWRMYTLTSSLIIIYLWCFGYRPFRQLVKYTSAFNKYSSMSVRVMEESGVTTGGESGGFNFPHD